MHSTVSDGTLGPGEVVEAAARAGVGVLALTDHDDVAGVAEAQARGAALGIEVWSGVELSVCEDHGDLQVHVLGLGVDCRDAPLLDVLARVRQTRRERGARILERLAEAGIDLSLDTLTPGGEPRSIGRLHVADALVRAGAARSRDDAFARYLRSGRPAYQPSPGIGAAEAIARIRGAGGLACLAHPPLSVGATAPGGLDALVERLARLGLDGVEVWHSGHQTSQVRRLRRIARKRGLVQTGGSDFHGDAKPGITPGRGRHGNVSVGREVYDALHSRLAERRAGG
jgi:predicted metal-dependent phosphoesterase TrpH